MGSGACAAWQPACHALDVEGSRWRARDQAARKAMEEEEAETARRRGLSDAQLIAEDEALGKRQHGKGKERQLKFMQKYYHKGAFYMDDGSLRKGKNTPAADNDVRQRNYDEATGEDQFDFAALPKVMQVKNFGRAGRTKYTHLKDQDTSEKDSLFAQGAACFAHRGTRNHSIAAKRPKV